MEKHNTRAIIKSSNPIEDKYFLVQLKVVYDEFFKSPSTMKELSVKTGIDRASICWYCRTMRQNKQIAVVKRMYCSITKRLVNQYTTNPLLMPIQTQLNLF